MEKDNTSQSKEFVKELSRQSREFCIIGLTGKVRSGTSDVCYLLTRLDFPSIMDLPASYQDNNAREYRIIYRYLRENWKPFVELNVTSVITSYLLELDPKDLEKFSCLPRDNASHPIGKAIHDILSQCGKGDDKEFSGDVLKKAKQVKDILLYSYEDADRNIGCSNLEKAYNRIQTKHKPAIDFFFQAWKEIGPRISDARKERDLYFEDFVFCFGILPVLEERLKKKLKDDDRYPIAFQCFGNNIRATGCATGVSEHNQICAENLFALPNRINTFMKLLRRYPLDENKAKDTVGNRAPVYVVINNFKNIFEAYYFKRRYSAFYLMSVSCDEAMRRQQFKKHDNYVLTNLREDLSSGKKIFKSTINAKCFNEFQGIGLLDRIQEELGADDATKEFIEQLFYSKDQLRRISYEQNLAPFILQDVVTCIENADIFVNRDHREPNCQYDQQLIRMIGRVVTLILHPGLLTPTGVERCMQVAMTAKLNSGCLSRQVGAVVADLDYNILSLGWNDAPCGAESCLRRNFFDLARKSDKGAYSHFELYNEEFRSYVDQARRKLGPRMRELRGLPMAFCFKDLYQDLIKQRDQIYTRALHGEERALAACGNERAKGGYLFTTSSPCELCAKRAKEAGISTIYYIEQYPGISRDHVTNIGPEDTRAKYAPFVGAVGLAYTKLYTPLIPYKDEIAALGFSPVDAYDTYKKTYKGSDPSSTQNKDEDSMSGSIDPSDLSGDLNQTTQLGQVHQPK